MTTPTQAAAVPQGSWWDRVPDALLAGGLLLSYVTLRDVARTAGFTGWLDDVFPLLLDVFLLYAAREATRAATEGDGRAAWWAVALVALFTVASGGLQAWSAWAPHGVIGAAVHAVPAIVVLLAFEMRQRRLGRIRKAALAAAEQSARDTVRAELRAELAAEVRAELRAELAAEVAAELRAELRPELEPVVRAELIRLDTRNSRRKPGRKPVAERGPSKKERGLKLLAGNPRLTPAELARELGCTDRYARDLIDGFRNQRGEEVTAQS